MQEFSVMFFSLKKRFVLEVHAQAIPIDNFVFDFITMFAHNVDEETFRIGISCLQENTDNLRKQMAEFVDKYKKVDAALNRLTKFLRQLDEGEYFYVLPNVKKLPDIQVISIYNELLSYNDSSVNLSQIQGFVTENLKCVFDNYEIANEWKTKIGLGLKEMRVCRFCKRSKEDGASFKQQAHAISEALGNKNLFLNEECDECNSFFSRTIENDIITYLKLYATFFGIKNKDNSVSKIKGKNFEYANLGNRNIVLKYIGEDDSAITASPPKSIPLKFHDKLILQNIYKALCKFALSIIDSKNLASFSRTTEWIRSEKFIKKLPRVAVLPSYRFFDTQPKMIVYTRKSSDKNLPFAVAEFHFTFLTFVFIIPTFSDIEDDFLNDDEYSVFWECFKHYRETKGWNFDNLSDQNKREVVFNLKLEQTKI